MATSKEVNRFIVNEEIKLVYGCRLYKDLPLLPHHQAKLGRLNTSNCGIPAMRQLHKVKLQAIVRSSRSENSCASTSSGFISSQSIFEKGVQETIDRKPKQLSLDVVASSSSLISIPLKYQLPRESTHELIKPKKIAFKKNAIDTVDENVPPTDEPKFFRKATPIRHSVNRSHQFLRDEQMNAYLRNGIMGDHESPPVIFPQAVKLYLCSSGIDMMVERHLLHTAVFPIIRQECHSLGFDFLVYEMEFYEDVETMTSDDLKFSDDLIDKCYSESVGPAFLGLFGDRCGQPLPNFGSRFPKVQEHRHELPTLNQSDKKMRNSSIILQQPKCATEEELPNTTSGNETLETNDINTSKLHRQSGLERQIHLGVLTRQDADYKSLCFNRQFRGLSEDVDSAVFSRYADTTQSDKNGPPVRDRISQRKLVNLISDVCDRIGEDRLKTYVISWYGAGVHGDNCKEHGKYLEEIVRDLTDEMSRLVQLNNNLWTTLNSNKTLYDDIVLHVKTCERYRYLAVLRKELLLKVAEYFESVKQGRLLNESLLVSSSDPGSGKSHFLVSLLRLSSEWLGANSVRLIRFLGDAEYPGGLRQVLVNLCRQIATIYNMEPIVDEHDLAVTKIMKKFFDILNYVSRHYASKRPLLIILDDIDAVKFTSYPWIPSPLPTGIHVIASVKNSLNLPVWLTCRCLSQTKETDDINLTTNSTKDSTRPPLQCDICNLSEEEVNQLIGKLFNAKNGRQLSPKDRKQIHLVCHASRNPLFIQLISIIVLDQLPGESLSDRLPRTIEGAIIQLIDNVKNIFGKEFVETFVCAMCLVPTGLAEGELRDILACQNSVFVELNKAKDPLLDSRQYYNLVLLQLNKLLERLKRVIVSARKSGKDLFVLSHRKMYPVLSETVREKRLTMQEFILEYFSQEKLSLRSFKLPDGEVIDNFNCSVLPQLVLPSNLRRLDLLPKLIAEWKEESDCLVYLKENCFCCFVWLFHKFQSSASENISKDLQMIKTHDVEIDILKRWLYSTKNSIQREPLTLASQLFGCFPAVNSDRCPFLNGLLESAKNWISNCSDTTIITPVFTCLPSALDPCIRCFPNMCDVIGFDEYGKLGVLTNGNSVVEVWDMVNNEKVFLIGIQYDRITPNVFVSKNRIMGLNKSLNMRIWDIQTAIELQNISLKNHFDEPVVLGFCLCFTENFQAIAFYMSDEENQQCISVFELDSKEIVSSIRDISFRDELHQRGTSFCQSGDVIIYTVTHSDGLTEDSTTCANLTITVYAHHVVTGERWIVCRYYDKHFVRLFVKDAEIFISWEDSGFEIHSVTDREGEGGRSLSPPEFDLGVSSFCVDHSDTLMVLSGTVGKRKDQYFGLWKWKKNDLVPLTILKQSIQSHLEIPTSFHSISAKENVVVLVHSKIGVITLWDEITGTVLEQIQAHSIVDSVTQMKDYYELITSSHKDKELKLWNIYSFLTPESRRTVQRVYSSSYHEESISWDFHHSQLTNVKPEVVGVTSYAASSDGLYVVTAFGSGSVPAIWNSETGMIVRRLENWSEMSSSFVLSIDLACDDEFVVAICESSEGTGDPYNIYKYQSWSFQTAKCRQPSEDVTNLRGKIWTVTNDKRYVVILSVDFVQNEPNYSVAGCILTIIDVDRNDFKRQLTVLAPSVPKSMQMSYDDTYALLFIPRTFQCNDVGVVPISDEELLDMGDRVDLKLYNFCKGTKHREYGATANVPLPNGFSLAAGLNGDIQMWEISSCQYEQNLYFDSSVRNHSSPNLHNHNDRMITHMVLSKDGRYLLVGAMDGAASLWDLAELAMVHMYPDHKDKISRVAISSDNKLVLTAGADCWLLVWERQVTVRPLCRIYIHVTAVQLQMNEKTGTIVVLGRNESSVTRFLLLRLTMSSSRSVKL